MSRPLLLTTRGRLSLSYHWRYPPGSDRLEVRSQLLVTDLVLQKTGDVLKMLIRFLIDTSVFPSTTAVTIARI
jgi:hypothetical protein